LYNSLLSSSFLQEPPVREELLSQLESKAKTEFVLNILSFADFSLWQKPHLLKFIDYIDEITSEPHE